MVGSSRFDVGLRSLRKPLDPASKIWEFPKIGDPNIVP